jgi:hypothetical protein
MEELECLEWSPSWDGGERAGQLVKMVHCLSEGRVVDDGPNHERVALHSCRCMRNRRRRQVGGGTPVSIARSTMSSVAPSSVRRKTEMNSISTAEREKQAVWSLGNLCSIRALAS